MKTERYLPHAEKKCDVELQCLVLLVRNHGDVKDTR